MTPYYVTDLTGIEHFESLRIIRFSYPHNLSNLPALPPYLEELKVYQGQLTALPELPSTLKILDCGRNQLTELPDLPSGLERLICKYNALTELPPLPQTLGYLECNSNLLTTLPVLSDSLWLLDCSVNMITQLPTLPDGLNTLHCDSNALTALPELPSEVGSLKCSYNEIDVLPVLPSTLYELWCRGNNITQLPQIPSGLNSLWCSHNQLTSLPVLPATLNVLNCAVNQITQLTQDYIPRATLYCDSNLLTTLPLLHPNLTNLGVSHNQIAYLQPDLPASLNLLSVSGNPIYCLPLLPYELEDLYVHDTYLNCMPNRPYGSYSMFGGGQLFQMSPDTFDLCTVNNLHACYSLPVATGVVFNDVNGNCVLDAGEEGLSGRVVYSDYGTYAISDTSGNYLLQLDTGTHTVAQNPENFWHIDCLGIPYSVVVDTLMDSIPALHFPNSALENCHWLRVNVGASQHRPCFNTNYHIIHYGNIGTLPANGAYVELTFPDEIIPYWSSIPWTALGNGIYRFDVGSVAVEGHGSFTVRDSVSCDAEVGITPCVKAEIFPLSPCLNADSSWDESTVAVSVACNGNTTIDFTISNTGSGNMAIPSNYRVYSDNALLTSDTPFQLNAGQQMVVSIPASGSTFRLEADQSIGHPGLSRPRAFIEGCGMPPFSLDQINAVSQDDADDYRDYVCKTLSSAYDPNDKNVVPSGVSANHYVHPNDSILEYTIRFQNTGSDTAFNIEVVDTLPAALLNPLTFVSGVSSHPYTVRIEGPGMVTWSFTNILLPDSTTNEPGSNGFVKFGIRTRPGLPNGTVVNNRVAIYFDYNEPIITNTAFITISDMELIVDAEDLMNAHGLNLFPNPMHTSTTLEFEGILTQGVVRVFDALGRIVYEQPMQGNRHSIERSSLASGIYVVAVYDGNQSIGKERLSVW